MTIFLRAARLVLPILFFGYGIFANIALMTGPMPTFVLPDDGLLSGGLTRDLDAVYKKDLPHMGLSFGMIGAARYALLGEARQGAIVGRNGWLFSAEEARPAPKDDRQLALVIGAILEIRAQLMVTGTELVIVPLPAKIDIYRKVSPNEVLGKNLEDLYATFSHELAAQGLAVVNVRRTFLNPVDPVFFASDTHWTPKGADMAAIAISASGTILRGPMAYERTESAPKTLIGDLIQFVTTATLAPRIGLPTESVVPMTQTPTNGGADIFGGSTTDIVLVGTSYSQNSDWGFADALMRELGRDVINVAKQGLGPLQPMQDYLASLDFRDDPPAIVIWEIPIRYLTDPTVWPVTVTKAPAVAPPLQKENADG